MDITDEDWAMVRRLVPRTIRSSLHCSIASLNPDGSPHVTPIGSFLPTEKGRGVYFDAFNAQLSANVDRDPRVTILAVNGGPSCGPGRSSTAASSHRPGFVWSARSERSARPRRGRSSGSTGWSAHCCAPAAAR